MTWWLRARTSTRVLFLCSTIACVLVSTYAMRGAEARARAIDANGPTPSLASQRAPRSVPHDAADTSAEIGRMRVELQALRTRVEVLEQASGSRNVSAKPKRALETNEDERLR